MKKIVYLVVMCMLTAVAMRAQQVVEMPVWPDGPQESNGITEPETTDAQGGRIRNISVASIRVYPADEAKNTGYAVLICPGGGYLMEAAEHEGSQFAEWYAANGITAVVLKYRLPNKRHAIPLKDAQEAMRIIRNNAAKWGVDPEKVGVSGFSAGGHLASTLLTHFDETSRPDFGILFYPVISMKESLTHQGSRKNLLGDSPDNKALTDWYSNEDRVGANTPKTLLLLSDDDKAVKPENSSLFYNALKAHGIPASLYVFPVGGHGWGFKRTFTYHEEMKSLVLAWLLGKK